jgi:hypothetical protein
MNKKSYESIVEALSAIEQLDGKTTIVVAEPNVKDVTQKSLVQLMEIAANKNIKIEFVGTELQKKSRFLVLVVMILIFSACFAPTLLSPLVNADGMSLLVVQGIWTLGLAKLGFLARIGIRPTNYSPAK